MKDRICLVQTLGGMALLSRDELDPEHLLVLSVWGWQTSLQGQWKTVGKPVSTALGPPGPCHHLEAPVACESPKKGRMRCYVCDMGKGRG